MCGIVGTNFISNNFDKATNLLKHRGPDNQSSLVYNNNQFGHTRLAIIDIDSEANQPMEFDDIIIVFNGEIYNYKELITKESLMCQTKSDTEVLIRMYQKYGIDFLDKLNGMFSFCIYDKKLERFFCARDRFGKKPFYYYFKNGRFIYASEIKSILALLEFTPTMNINALDEYLSFLSPLNETFYSDIHKLSAGCFMIVENNNLKLSQYYDINNIQTQYFDEKKILNDIEDILLQSVNERLVGDVEVATLLSGGVDSSLVSALYAKQSKRTINTFCIGYDEYTHYSELPYAKIVAKHIKSNHHELIINKKDFINTIDAMINHTDEPFGDSASIPTYLLSEYIHNQDIKVALSGEGSDESFLGYDNYFKMLNYYNNTQCKKEDFNLTKEWEYNNRAFLKEQIYRSCGETFTTNHKKLLFTNHYERNLLSQYKSKYSPVKWLSYIDFKIWIAEVLMTKIDRMSMAHSLELRAPFLDYRLVEYMFGVDDKVKLGNTNKYLLKQIAIKYLPNEIVHRQKKGFSSPFIEWLYEEYNSEILNKIKKVNKELNLFNMDFVKFLYNEAKEKRFKQHIWNLYIFAKWYEKVYM